MSAALSSPLHGAWHHPKRENALLNGGLWTVRNASTSVPGTVRSEL